MPKKTYNNETFLKALIKLLLRENITFFTEIDKARETESKEYLEKLDTKEKSWSKERKKLETRLATVSQKLSSIKCKYAPLTMFCRVVGGASCGVGRNEEEANGE